MAMEMVGPRDASEVKIRSNQCFQNRSIMSGPVYDELSSSPR